MMECLSSTHGSPSLIPIILFQRSLFSWLTVFQDTKSHITISLRKWHFKYHASYKTFSYEEKSQNKAKPFVEPKNVQEFAFGYVSYVTLAFCSLKLHYVDPPSRPIV